MSLTLAPLRLLVILVLLSFSWLCSQIGRFGISAKECEENPFVSWRQKVQKLLLKTFRLIFFFMGFHKINVIGHQVKNALLMEI